jgi:D-3-phosphoglycerate dehydrogenase
MNILISDKIDLQALDIFSANKYVYDYLPEITSQELTQRIDKYQALVVRSRTKVTKEIISKGKSLKVIGRVGSGIDNIDWNSAQNQGIVVTNAPYANSQAVAEHTIGLILSLLRNYKKAFLSMDKGLWLKKELSGKELNSKAIGIIGYGNIGKKVDNLVKAFGAKTHIFSRSYSTTSLDDLFLQSDIITIHLALNDHTKGMINAKLLGLMHQNALFINASRGEIVDEEALYQLLITKKIAGAALDVFSTEPLAGDSKWRKLENCLLTPHIGASTKEALIMASITVVGDVINILSGKKPKFPAF